VLWCSRIFSRLRRSSGALSLHSDQPRLTSPQGNESTQAEYPPFVTYLAEASMHEPFEHTVTPGRHA
jgi:hypothetical protein